MNADEKKIRGPAAIDRRAVVASGLGAMAAPALLGVIAAHAQSKTIKIGYVSAKTGALAVFTEADNFILDQMRNVLAKGLQSGGKTYPVEILARDSQSSGTRAAAAASDLISKDKVDLILAASPPTITNPVADQADANAVPCVTTGCAWQPYFFSRNRNPPNGVASAYHFYWGLEDVIASYLALWDGAATNKIVGGLFADDIDGNVWLDPQRGLPPALAAAGYTLHVAGRYEPLNDDFTPQIALFKQIGADIVVGSMTPPDFMTFWSQAAQQGFRPKIVTIDKALAFPATIAALGDRGDGLSTEISWTPNFPFKSGLTGQTARELAAAYMSAARRPWTQPLGYQHAVFEVAIDVLKRAKGLDAKSILDAVIATNYQSIVGLVKWTGQPVKTVTKTPLVAGQWQRKEVAFDLVITENKTAPQIPVGGKLALLA
jgi:branched-chain amino acid transport system substrate-binding protein